MTLTRKPTPLLPQNSGTLPAAVIVPLRATKESDENGKTSSQVLLPNLANSPEVLLEAYLYTTYTKPTFWNKYGGMIMALSASLFFSSAFLMIKTLEKDGVGSFGSALLFNSGVLLPCLVFIVFNEFGPGWKRRDRILQDLWPIDSTERMTTIAILAVQGTLQGISVIFRTYSLRYLTLADTTVIVFSSPVVTTAIAHFVLGEKCGCVFIGIALFTLVGVALITRPPVLTGEKEFDTNTLIGSGLAAGALLSLSLKFVITRKIKHAHFLTMTFFLGFFGVLISLPLFLIFEEPESLIPTTMSGLLLRIGLLTGFCAVASINVALKLENAGLVALIRSCDVIFAFLLQYVFLGVVPDWLSVVGATIVWTGVLVAGGRKLWKDKANRKRLRLEAMNS